ncbi:peptidylprolyl isomerase [Anaerobacillus alkaliphilus]|uniref:Peptidyl-prolyl cis-trans isomerase n=1 Tax=Anaerobacillus alkaliphilus TaxID=1548597 RepID=A0A4Q0VP12_9BACI|nr:peptidylprolyl isomerase [Anaerobacillus alkaliphilus]RXI97849.1 peptidylprolyl isomerase [Anaerobacillus alkaliphilus]
MRFMKYGLLSFLLLVLISGCGQGATEERTGAVNEEEVEVEQAPSTEEVTPVEYPQFHAAVQPEERMVKMVTSMGDITIRLFPQYAPLAVENFITHSENGYYDGVLFHRVIEGFMVQSGDPEGTGRGGESIYGQPFADEFSPSLGHYRGALSMANPDRPDTNGSQFFIVQSNDFDPRMFEQIEKQYGVEFPEETIKHYEQHGGTPFLDYRHTVFGHVFEGMDVVDAIAQVQVGQNDRPIEDVIIQRIEILQ